MVVVVELAHREVVGHDGAVEAPLAAQQIGQQPAVGTTGQAVDLVVAVHHRGEAAVAHRRLERAQVDVAQLALGRWAGAQLRPPSDAPYPTKCLAVATTPVAEVGALQALDERDAHLRHEVRILAVRLLEPPPARVAAHVEHRRQALVGADRAHLEPDGVGDRTVVLGPERAGDAERLREHRGLPRHEARADLLVHDGGDAEAGVVDEVPLDLVGERRRGGGARSCSPRSSA